MSVGFPPYPVYPIGIDSDYTLFLVYNTTESVLAANNNAWSEEILIQPVGAGKAEIWPSNGFATIEGELLYYDAVSTDSNGKVYKLRRCCRNIGGRHTQYNAAGTWIRGFVIAEHHNQLVNGIINTQTFIGENFSADETTLDWRIRHLQAQSPVFSDQACPDVEFDFSVINQSPSTGTLVSYSVVITGGQGSALVQFGDGSSSTQVQGTHQYAPNANIDPVVIVTSGQCTVVQTPIQRDQTQEPTVPARTPPFTVSIPTNPQIPNITLTTQPIPSTDLVLPPIVFPCLDLNPLTAALSAFVSVVIPIIDLPSAIIFSSLPSVITFVPSLTFPSIISFVNIPSFGPIGFGPAPTFGPIGFGAAPPLGPVLFGPAPALGPIAFGPAPTVQFGPVPTIGPVLFGPAPAVGPVLFGPAPAVGPILFGPAPLVGPIDFGPAPFFAPIEFGTPPAFSTINFGTPPVISVQWGTPPAISCACGVTCPSAASAAFGMAGGFAFNPATAGEMAPDPGFDTVELQYDMVGFPSEIKVVVPDIPPISVTHNIPEFVSLVVPEMRDISIIGPQVPIPNEIRIVPPDMDTVLNVISFNIPSTIRLDATGIPAAISVVFPEKIPMISFDITTIPESIKVVGIPDIIRLEHHLPSVIDLGVPEGLKVPLVFDGPPLSAELKINWGLDKFLKDGEQELPCFAILPCPK